MPPRRIGDDIPLVMAMRDAFAPLDRLQDGLAERVATHVVRGGDDAVVPALVVMERPLGFVVENELRTWGMERKLGPLLGGDVPWRPAAVTRFGQVTDALIPIAEAEHVQGTDRAPAWLRAVLHYARGIADPALVLTFERVLEIADGRADVLLDLLCHANPYRERLRDRKNPLAGAEHWLASHQPRVGAAAATLTPAGLAVLIRVIGRYALVPVYRDAVFGWATGSRAARAAAVEVLAGLDPTAFADGLRAAYAAALPKQRISLIGLATAVMGPGAAPLLAGLRDGETDRAAKAAIARALAPPPVVIAAPVSVVAAPAPDPGAALPPEPADGYRALDGSIVTLPPRQPSPEPSVVPDALLAPLAGIVARYNEWVRSRRRPRDNHVMYRGYYVDEVSPDAVAQFVRHLHEPRPAGTKGGNPLGLVFRMLAMRGGSDRDAVVRLLQSPAVTARHLTNLCDDGSTDYLDLMSRRDAPNVEAELWRRIAAGADCRMVRDLFTADRCLDPFLHLLTGRGMRPETLARLPAVWPWIAERLDLLDQALGLRPAGNDGPFDRALALDLLAALPKVPARYRDVLIAMGLGPQLGLRDRARRLLAAHDVDAAIGARLSDRRPAIRASAAEWLGERRAGSFVPALRSALAGERNDIARAALATALTRLGEDLADRFDRTALAAEAAAELKKRPALTIVWFPFADIPVLRWDDGKPVDPAIPQWWVMLANKLGDPAGDPLFRLWLGRLHADDADAFGRMVARCWIARADETPDDPYGTAFIAAMTGRGLLALTLRVRQPIAEAAGFIARYDRRVLASCQPRLDELAAGRP